MNAEWPEYELPEDPQAERSLLSTICAAGANEQAAECSIVLREDDFTDPKHRAVYNALLRLQDSHQDANALTLKAQLEKSGQLGLVGDYPGLLGILSAEEVGNPMTLVEIIQKHRKRRELMRLGGKILQSAADPTLEPSEVVESASSGLASIGQVEGDQGPTQIADTTDEAIERILAEARGDRTFGVRTGFYRFDGITKGFKPGNLIILAARPAVGKTSLALNWALRSSALSYQGAVVFFSLEMAKNEVTGKLLSDLSSVNLHDLDMGDTDALDKLSGAKGELDTRNILLDDRSETTVRQIRSKLERIQARTKVAMVIVDYLQLLTSVDPMAAAKQNEATRVGDISRALKLMAKDCKVPVIVLSQLNREIEKRSNQTPQLSDLRDSGAIEQDADMVIFIHRKIQPDLAVELQDKNGKLIIAKHRNGPTGSVPVSWDGGIGRYTEEERETKPVDMWS